MSQIIQCVPNFSEGRRADVVREIALSINSTGARVIDYSLDEDHNRSVITLLGDPDAVRRSILAGIRTAVDLIDMRMHSGGHPRIGAADVIPLIPIQEVTMEECVALSRLLGADIANELGIPVYLYENSAAREDRRNLADIRKGGYESLCAAELTADRIPDFGPKHLHPSAGATVVGARGPLIAFNVDLLSDDRHLASRIASSIRRARNEGTGFSGVKAIGVELLSKGIVQVSTNITDPDKVTMFEVYDFVRRRAAEAGVSVLRSELIGVARLDSCTRSLAQALQLEDFGQERILDHWLRADI